MSLTTEQLAELTNLINERFDEWHSGFRQVCIGEIRLIFGAFEEWSERGGPCLPAKTDPVAGDLTMDMYYVGYERGKAAALKTITLIPGNEVVPNGTSTLFGERPTENWQDFLASPGEPDGEWQRELVAQDAAIEDQVAEEEMGVAAIPAPAHECYESFSDATAATLGPEHTINSPLKPKRELTPARRRQLDRLSLERRTHKDERERKAQRGTQLPTLDQIIAELQRQANGTRDMPSQATFDTARPAVWSKATSITTRFGLSWEQLADKAGLIPGRRGPKSVA